LESLVNSYIQLTNLPDASFILRKICGTISAFFLKAFSDWKRPIRNVIASFLDGRYVSEDSLGNSESFIFAVSKVKYHQLRGLLWLCLDLAEGVDRFDTGTPKG
jgi:hypothetical protein